MGGYGSSGWDAQRQRDEGAFAQQLGNTMNQLYGDEYNRSANLYEQGLNRATNAYTASQQNNNQLLSQIPNLIGLDWQNIQQLQNAGDRQYAYQQTLLDSLNNDYQNYNNFGVNQNNMLGQLLRNHDGHRWISHHDHRRRSFQHGRSARWSRYGWPRSNVLVSGAEPLLVAELAGPELLASLAPETAAAALPAGGMAATGGMLGTGASAFGGAGALSGLGLEGAGLGMEGALSAGMPASLTPFSSH